jgi:hypothetical protein
MENQKISSETHLPANLKDMSLLVNKPYVAYVFKKTQKIAQAIYLISDFFDPAEPLRNSFRSNASLLLHDAGIFLKNDQKDTESVSRMLTGSFLGIIGLVETAELINLLSEKNAKILKEEITHVVEQIELNREKKIQLSKEFISTPSLEEYKRQNVLYKGHDDVLNIKDKEIPIAQKDSSVVPKPPFFKVPPFENKAQRSVQIIALFKPGVELTIKDITSHLKEVSSKTVQRELLSLVARGSLKKRGEKRWSKYSLK